jgi:ankyrin repeat protein
MRTAIFGVLALAAMLASTIGFSAQDEKVDFARDVQPILRQQCVGCHGPTQQQNGFRLDQRRAAMRGSTVSPGIIRPGNSAASLFYLRISGNAAGPQMPPSGPLTAEQIAILRAWIDQGAEWPDALANDVTPPPLDPAATRLMDAALWGSAADVGRLLVRGVDPNVHNHAGATPLMWAVDDRAKSQLLVDYGADVNARSDDGRTPLMIAAGINGSAPVVRLLLDHGADMTVRAQSFWGRTTALAEAVLAGNLPVFDMLRKDGADLNAVGAWPAVLAVRGNCSGCAKVLLDALPQEQLAAAMYMIVPPLSDGLAIQSILARGGDANLRDLIGQTMLMRMAASDRMPVTVLNAMLAAGADVKARSKAGLTALAFAKARGETPVTRVLMTVGAIDVEPAPAGGEPERPVSPSPAASPRAAIERSLPLLQRTDVAFFKKSGCVSCHNNTLTAMSVAAARTHGIRVDDEIARHN